MRRFPVARVTGGLIAGLGLHAVLAVAAVAQTAPLTTGTSPSTAPLSTASPRGTISTGPTAAGPAAPAVLPDIGSSITVDRPTGLSPSLDQLGALRVGFLERDGADEAETRWKPLADAVKAEIGKEVRFVGFATGKALADGLASGRIDFAAQSGSAYAFTFDLCRCIEPLAVPTSEDGTAAVHAIMVVRAATTLTELTHLAGKRLATGPETSTATRILPLAMLAGFGIDPKTYFAAVDTYPTPAEALLAVAQGRADAAFTWSSLAGSASSGWTRGPITRLAASGQIRPGDLRVVWRSQPLPHPPVVVRKDLDAETRARLRHMMTTLAEKYPGAYNLLAGGLMGGFEPIEHGAFEPYVDVVGRGGRGG